MEIVNGLWNRDGTNHYLWKSSHREKKKKKVRERERTTGFTYLGEKRDKIMELFSNKSQRERELLGECVWENKTNGINLK